MEITNMWSTGRVMVLPLKASTIKMENFGLLFAMSNFISKVVLPGMI